MSVADVRRTLQRFLFTDPRDAGCGAATRTLHAYVELVAAGADAGAHDAGVAAHLRACPPCFDDYEGLLLTVRETGSPER